MMVCCIKKPWVATSDQPTSICVYIGELFIVLEVSEEGWVYGARLQDKRQGWFPHYCVEDLRITDVVSEGFITDILFNLACAVGAQGNSWIQLVLPPEYYTDEGKPIVPWKWLSLPKYVDFHCAWDSWEYTWLLSAR